VDDKSAIDNLEKDRSQSIKIYFYKIDNPYGCFSNFSPHPIELAGENWATVEHYYQAQKFLGTKFEDLMVQIQTAPTPAIAAQIGRNLEYQPHADWANRKREVMYLAVSQKFITHLSIQQILLETDNAEIIEDSPVDYFWGCGIEKNGSNHLGRILMEVRDRLKIDRTLQISDSLDSRLGGQRL
jgi:N-glycosidase YbiA